MPWNSVNPDGSKSVKANESIGQQNTTYIETTMGKSVVGTNTTSTRDHFWDVSSNVDGRHRFVQSPAFTVGGLPADPVIGTGMDGVRYLKTTNGQVLGFYRNVVGIYQYIPNFISGTVSITSTSTFVTVSAIPANVYGEISIWRGTKIQKANFVSSGSVVEGFSNRIKLTGVSDDYIIEFLNQGAVDLNLKARLATAISGTYEYRITYRAI